LRKLLKEKDCYFLKADKRNSVVVLDKSDYVSVGPRPKLKWRLRVTNPQMPRMYALPKIHMPGGKMRPTLSNISAVHEKMVKWLVPEFESIRPPEGLYVENTFEFVEKIKDIHIMPYDMMVSFDVEALFLSIPVDEALELLKK
jgi:hypothetical protein